jgi:hypothetical protein
LDEGFVYHESRVAHRRASTPPLTAALVALYLAVDGGEARLPSLCKCADRITAILEGSST